ncbi:MAG TPA: SEC-C metal-binding domain-containing protein [Chthoniobacterales bacterium]
MDAVFELHPAELMHEIRPLFRQGIVDPFMTSLEEFEREAKRDRATSLRQHGDRFRPITDTAQSISYWGRWKESSALHDSNTAHASSKSTPSPVPTLSTGSKVGRNEPCPCGSGKKYKKCCDRLQQ